MSPQPPPHDAKFDADVARLRAAKGIQFRAWFRENKAFAIGMIVYLLAIAGVGSWAYFFKKDVVLWGAFAVFWLPVVFLRVVARHRRRG